MEIIAKLVEIIRLLLDENTASLAQNIKLDKDGNQIVT